MADTPAPIKKVDPAVKWGSLFIIALMLLSGAAVYFGSQSATDTNANSTNPANTTVTTFTAEDVQGTVTNVFQNAVVGGSTTLSDKTTIDEALNKIPGVSSLNSQYTNLNSQDSSLTYVANISLKEGVDHVEFANAVEALDLFTAPEIFFQAAVQVPTTLQVVDSTNKSQSITIPDSQIQGIITATTLKGDTISGHFSAGYQGIQFQNAFLIETQNMSASPSPITFSGTYTLAHMDKSLTLAGSIDYFPDLSEDFLKNGVSQVAGVTNASTPIIPQLNNVLILSFTDANAVVETVQSFVAAHPNEYGDVQLVTDSLRVTLKDVFLEDAKAQLTSVVQDALLSNAPITFSDPVTQFLIDVNVNNVNTTPVAAKLAEYFASLNAHASVEMFQNGKADVNVLVDPVTGISYPVGKGELPVSVLPGHALGDTFTATINAIAVRGDLVYVNAVESADANSLSG